MNKGWNSFLPGGTLPKANQAVQRHSSNNVLTWRLTAAAMPAASPPRSPSGQTWDICNMHSPEMIALEGSDGSVNGSAPQEDMNQLAAATLMHKPRLCLVSRVRNLQNGIRSIPKGIHERIYHPF